MVDLGEQPFSAIGQMDGAGELVGGVVFHNFTGRDVHVHVAGLGPHWLTRRFLGECFRYVFFQLGCRRCTGLVARSNLAAQRFDLGLGFKYEGVLRAYLPEDEDCYIYGMLREECRWLNAGRRTHHAKGNTAPTIARLRPGRRAGTG
jgi:RimJ/RimL family protein N-acetyltransferase